ncbi:MAG: hypothetical protein ACKO85_01620 [Isosphaeraceae bacterium]
MLPAKTQPKQKKTDDLPILRLIRSATEEGAVRTWRINNQIVAIHCWTDDEYAALKKPPKDAVAYPSGVWIALRNI